MTNIQHRRLRGRIDVAILHTKPHGDVMCDTRMAWEGAAKHLVDGLAAVAVIPRPCGDRGAFPAKSRLDRLTIAHGCAKAAPRILRERFGFHVQLALYGVMLGQIAHER